MAMNPVCLYGPLFACVGFGSTAQAPMTTALGLSFDYRLAAKPSLTFYKCRACGFDGHSIYANLTPPKQPKKKPRLLDGV
jgi:hypothetical protein